MFNQIKELFIKRVDNSVYTSSSFHLLTSYLPDEAMLNGELQYATRPRVCLKDVTASFAHGNDRLTLKAHLRALELDLEQHATAGEAAFYLKVTNLFYKKRMHIEYKLTLKDFLNMLPTDRNAMFRDDPQTMQLVNYLNDGNALNLQTSPHASAWLMDNHEAFVTFVRRTCFPGRRPDWDKIKMLESAGVEVWCDQHATDINLRFRKHNFSL